MLPCFHFAENSCLWYELIDSDCQLPLVGKNRTILLLTISNCFFFFFFSFQKHILRDYLKIIILY